MTTLHNQHSRNSVAVLGGGPVGLAAAAHLLEHGLEPRIFEAGSGPGSTFRDVAHVRFFSPWRYNIDAAAARLLESTGWAPPPPDELPTAGELVRQYLDPLAAHPAIAERLHLSARVIGVTRQGVDKVRTAGRADQHFLVRLRNAGGGIEEHPAAAVIDTTGTWQQPNPLGANGLPAVGETELHDRIRYGMPDVLGVERDQYLGRAVLVVGAGHSAAGTLLALAELADQDPSTRVHWALRGTVPQRLLGNSRDDSLPARGAIGEQLRNLVAADHVEVHGHFPIRELRLDGQRIRVLPAPESAAAPLEGIDRIVAATGARPDISLFRELRVQLDPALECVPELAPLVDPNLHSCGTVPPHGHRELEQPEPGFYIAGAKSYGRAPTFLMITGYEQVRSIAAVLAGDRSAADRVTLELPETGVCGPPDGLDGDTAIGRDARGHDTGPGRERRQQPCCTASGDA